MSRQILQVTLPPTGLIVPVSNFSDARFPFRTPGGPFWSLSVGKDYVFASNSLTGSPICKPLDAIGYSTLEQSARAGF